MLKLSIIGNLGADVEKKNQNGREFFVFRVAHSERFTNKDTGEVTESTTWVSCIARNLSDNLCKYLRKGVKVFVRGNMSLRTFVYNHETRVGVNLQVQEIELCGMKEDKEQQPQVSAAESNDNDDPF